MKELHGKVAVITGAASGFGREFAIRCADEGMRVILTDIDTGGLGYHRRAAQAWHRVPRDWQRRLQCRQH